MIAGAFSIDDVLEAHDALAILASLPSRQRADLILVLSGYSYEEIRESPAAERSPTSTSDLAKARARLARLGDASQSARRALVR